MTTKFMAGYADSLRMLALEKLKQEGHYRVRACLKKKKKKKVPFLFCGLHVAFLAYTHSVEPRQHCTGFRASSEFEELVLV